MNILIIDDDESLDELFVTSAELAGFKAAFVKNVNDGLAMLTTQKFDAAILDLDFGDNEPTGESLVKKIEDLCLRIPVIVHSGKPDSAYSIKEKIFGIFKRGCDYNEIFNRLNEINATGISEIMGVAGEYEKILYSYYKTFFLDRKNLWIERAATESNRVKSSLIRAFSYQLEETIHNEGKIYNEEFYLTAQDDLLHRGSILKTKKEGFYYIVMTPSCDLVCRYGGKPKVKSITLCLIENIEAHGLSSIAGIDIADEERVTMVHPLFSNSNDNKEMIKYHWLPPIDSFNGGFVNFSKICSVPYKNIGESFEILRIKVAQPYIKNITSRFSSYFARQGQPDLDSDDFERSLKWSSANKKMSP